MLTRSLVGGVLALVLAGCATPSHVPFDPLAREKLAEVKVIDIVAQDEVIVRAATPDAMAAGGGLLGAVIVSKIGESRQNEVQAALAPFYATVDDFDFRSLFTSSLEKALAGEKSVRFGAIDHAAQHLHGREIKQRHSVLATNQGLMVLATTYTFSPDFRHLNITTEARLHQAAKEDPVYRNTYNYQSAPVGPGGSASLGAWGENKGERYRSAAGEGVAQIVRMIGIDLAAGPVAAAQGAKLSLTNYASPINIQVNGPVLDTQPARAIVRHGDGHLYSLPHNTGGQPQ